MCEGAAAVPHPQQASTLQPTGEVKEEREQESTIHLVTQGASRNARSSAKLSTRRIGGGAPDARASSPSSETPIAKGTI